MVVKILVVDDEPYVCKLLRKFLVEKGYEVQEANDGPGALAAYKRQRPDMVLLDIKMPGMDGIETLREIRALDPTACIIMITALHDETLARRAFSEGAREYITKPIDPAYLDVALKEALGGPGREGRE
jgi:CheY-like chemotaxis protein